MSKVYQLNMEKNITVNSVSPGFIISDMTAKISEEHTDMMKSRISLNKFGSPEDVANTIFEFKFVRLYNWRDHTCKWRYVF